MTHTTATRDLFHFRNNTPSRAFRSALAPALLLAVGIVLGLVHTLAAAPGDLDTTFGPDHTGRVLTDFFTESSDDAFAVALQPDGKIVMAGFSDAMTGVPGFAVARYTPDGNLDHTFASRGWVTTSFSDDPTSPDTEDMAFAVAIQPDGKIVAAGTSDTLGFALARYTGSGALDTAFAGTGKVMTTFGGTFEQANAVAIQPDGKIVAAGFSDENGSSDFALARYNADGSLDQSFGNKGLVLTDFDDLSDDAVQAITILPDGKILAAGYSDAQGDRDFALARYTSTGQLDTSFGTGGKVTTAFPTSGSDDEIRAIAIQSDGKIVVAGLSDGTTAFGLARYSANGAIDSTFGTNGLVTTPFSTATFVQAVGVGVQPDGKIVAGGPVDTAFVVARYNADGTLDGTYGSSGIAKTSFGGNPDVATDTAEAMALQPDGKAVLVGFSNAQGSEDFALVRFNGGQSSNTPLVAAVLPSSRSVQVGTPATAFATVINPANTTASAVGIALSSSIGANFSFQTTDPNTNQVTGSPNTPANIPPGKFQTYVITVTPTAAFDPTDVAFTFAGSNAGPAAQVTGLNTLLLSASNTPVPDIVALAATTGGNGILAIPGTAASGAFAVATVNVGAPATITASADTGGVSLPLTLSLCQTDPAGGQCISSIGQTVTTSIGSGETPTFGIFGTSAGAIPFAPAQNRVFVRFKDTNGTTRGSTSVAVRTP